MAKRKAGSAIVDENHEIETGSSAPQVSERNLERALGNQIRVLRRQHDLSVAELASAAGISNGMLSKIENGGISPSLNTLQSIAETLKEPLSSLFASAEERQDCSYVPAGHGVGIERRGSKVGHIYELLGHLLGGDIVIEPYLITLREGASAYTGFHHSGVEFIYMLDGEVDYRHGANVYSIKPGDSLLFDSSALHGPDKLANKECRYLSIIVYPRH
ncbi:helix-turn-helix domain-containing protein [Croceicoccus bisphenolivorans]|uniref:helix-turn-helix domain-containing protein n=1 Tax=Croceicoccus bisphenolivorans TaxID=1783232 RepID=UPI000829FBF3|nr:XRE family transcriptional regulator [Croceicoccus bisphenolivorans]